MMDAALPPLIVATPVLAGLLGVSPRRVQQLHKEGVFSSVGHGRWDAMHCVPAALAHRLESEMARLAREPAEDRVRQARAREIELRIARDQRDLIPTDEAFGIIEDIIGIYRSSYGGLPARVTRDPVLRRRLEAEVDATQHRVADTLEKRMRECGREVGDAV